jgi:hypothetical protein
MISGKNVRWMAYPCRVVAIPDGPNIQYVHALRAGLCHAPARREKCPSGNADRAPGEAHRRIGEKTASPLSKCSNEAAP